MPAKSEDGDDRPKMNNTIEEHKAVSVTSSTLEKEHGISLTSFIGVLLVAVVFYNVGGSLSDNSFLTHLATGRYILDAKTIPTTDIYSFTSPDTPWVVQSWLVSVVYASAETVLGALGIRVIVGTVAALTVFLLWREAAKLNLLMRTVSVGFVATLGMLVWSARPTVLAFLFLVLVYLAAREKIPRWSLVVVGALWVTSHGSWPIALVVLGVFALSKIATTRQIAFTREVRSLVYFASGLLLGSLISWNVSLLTFPLESFRRADVLSKIVEWQPTGFFSTVGLLLVWPSLIFAAVSLRRKGGLDRYLLFIFAVVLGFSAARNATFTNIIFFFIVVDGFAGVGRNIGTKKKKIWGAAALLVVSYLTFAFLTDSNWDLEWYPAAEVSVMEEAGWMKNPDVRVAATVGASNYLSLRYGPEHKIVLDDRFDMFDKEVIFDIVDLNNDELSNGQILSILDKYNIDVVLWETEGHLVSVLEESPAWRQYGIIDEGWRIFCNTRSANVTCGPS